MLLKENIKKTLVEKTSKIFEKISKKELIKSYYPVGCTALALQINHRLNEDF